MMGIASGLTSPLAADGSFPLPPPDPPDKQNADRLERESSIPFLLLIEDNAADVDIISRALRPCSIIDLKIASDGEQGLRILQQSERGDHELPSVILLDWNLPRVSGAEVLAYIRHSEYLQHVPVVVITSTESPSDIEQIQQIGATAYFRKSTDLGAYLELKALVFGALPKPPRSS
jgi:two-component system, chemotaxis family, response regulator Rcp1